MRVGWHAGETDEGRSTVEPRAQRSRKGGVQKGGVGQQGGVMVAGIGIFRLKVEEKEDYVTREYQILQKTDWYSLLSKQYIHRVEVNGMYKRKAEKVRPVDLGESDGNKPGGGSMEKKETGRRKRGI